MISPVSVTPITKSDVMLFAVDEHRTRVARLIIREAYSLLAAVAEAGSFVTRGTIGALDVVCVFFAEVCSSFALSRRAFALERLLFAERPLVVAAAVCTVAADFSWFALEALVDLDGTKSTDCPVVLFTAFALVSYHLEDY